jgi:xanthine dehydrogenase YagR molybdenum-binding subunit
MKDTLTGKGVDRVDGRLKVTGAAPYVAEISVAGVAHAVIVTSPVGPGTIAAIETKEAKRAAGVLAVLTHLNAPKLPGATMKANPFDRLLQVLQDDQVLYADQPLAVVVAETLEEAQHAASLVRVRIEGPEPKVDLRKNLADAYKPPGGPLGQPDSQRGDVEAGFAMAAHKVEQSYTTPTEHHNPLEMHATTSVWHGDQSVTLYDSTQGIFGVRKKVAAVFGIPVENVRVISPYVGGGFGCKGTPWSHVILSAMASRVAKRPVKLVLTRPQMFTFTGNRPDTIQHVALGADASGKLLAVKHDVISYTSSFDEFLEPAGMTAPMLYACPNVSVSHRLVKLDVPTPTFTRAPGKASGTFALESALDELAYSLELDPLELRLLNYAERDPSKDLPWSSKALRECYQQGAERFGWSERPMQVRARREGDHWKGWGMATATYPAEQGAAKAIARLRKDGRLLVQAGSQDIGTGTYTIMTQLAADALSLPMERVRFELGDTDMPETPVSGGSMTAATVGSAVKLATLALKDTLVATAIADASSPLYGLPPEQVIAEQGVLKNHDGTLSDQYADVVARAGVAELSATAQSTQKPERSQYSLHAFGAQFVEVKVDEALGSVRVTRCVGAFAAGKILNAKTAKSQFQGGIIWGIGMALHEETIRDARTGRCVTRDLADYHVPAHADIPNIEIVSVHEDDPYVSEIGAKGIGEIGITGVTAAIANAVFHATGKRIRDLPITLDKLL